MKKRCISAGVWLLLLLGFEWTSGLAQSRRDDLVQLNQALERVTARVRHAVVQIIATGYTQAGAQATASNLLEKRRSSGSGVILDPEGYIVTNAHVVEGARRIQVVLSRPPRGIGSTRSVIKPPGVVVEARIVGVDRETDLAVLKIRQTGLAYLELGDSERLRQGELVLAFGSPLGLQNSVSLGVVSAPARQLRPEDPMIYIQTDASINPGNSGGPLVDLRGQVVGINTFIVTQSGGNEGIGFAVPSNIVANIYRQLRETGRVRRGVIGVYAQTITPLLASGLGLPQVWGVILGDVQPGSPARAAGLKVGDIVLRLDGKVMENGRQFDVNLYRRSGGETVSLEVLRGGDTLQVEVQVAERQEFEDRFSALVTPEDNLIHKLGILGLDLTPEIARYLPRLRLTSGVVVASGAANLSWRAGDRFQPGDVIHAVNRYTVRNLEELRRVLADLEAYDPVVVQIERRGQFRFLAFELE